MTQKRLLCDEPIADKEEVLVRGPAAHHLANVMRVRRGERIEVRDGRGCAWLGEVVRLGSQEVTVRKLDQQDPSNESPLALTVALGYARAEKMDLVLRQATELGVQRIVAFRAARSQYRLSGGQSNQRSQRWFRIASEALRQCGRLCLPEIEVLPDVEALLAKLPEWELAGEDGLRIMAWEEERRQSLWSLWEELPRCTKAMLVIGPEGGFTPGEVEQFRISGFRPVHLGPRTLRLETAATALIASTQLLWGDLSKRVDGSEVYR